MTSRTAYGIDFCNDIVKDDRPHTYNYSTQSTERDASASKCYGAPSLWDRNSDKIKSTVFRAAVNEQFNARGIPDQREIGLPNCGRKRLSSVWVAAAQTPEPKDLVVNSTEATSFHSNGLLLPLASKVGSKCFSETHNNFYTSEPTGIKSRESDQLSSVQSRPVAHTHLQLNGDKIGVSADQPALSFTLDSSEELAISVCSTSTPRSHCNGNISSPTSVVHSSQLDENCNINPYSFDLSSRALKVPDGPVTSKAFSEEAFHVSRPAHSGGNHLEFTITYRPTSGPKEGSLARSADSHNMPNIAQSHQELLTPDDIYDNMNTAITHASDYPASSHTSPTVIDHTGKSQTLPQKFKLTSNELYRNYSESATSTYDPTSPQITREYVDHVMALATDRKTPRSKSSNQAHQSGPSPDCGYGDDEVFSDDTTGYSYSTLPASTPTQSVLSEYFNQRKELSSQSELSMSNHKRNSTDYACVENAKDIHSSRTASFCMDSESDLELYDNDILHVEMTAAGDLPVQTLPCVNIADPFCNHVNPTSYSSDTNGSGSVSRDNCCSCKIMFDSENSIDEDDVGALSTPEHQLVLGDIRFLEYKLQMVSLDRINIVNSNKYSIAFLYLVVFQ